MATVGTHLKTHHGSNVELLKALKKEFDAVVEEEGKDSKWGKRYAGFSQRIDALIQHNSNMKQSVGNVAEITPQGQLLPALTANQPYTRSTGGDLNKLIPDRVSSLSIPHATGKVPEHISKILGTLSTEDADGPIVHAVPRKGQPGIGADRAGVPVELQSFVKTSQDESE
jgi:hypothetical protein